MSKFKDFMNEAIASPNGSSKSVRVGPVDLPNMYDEPYAVNPPGGHTSVAGGIQTIQQQQDIRDVYPRTKISWARTRQSLDMLAQRMGGIWNELQNGTNIQNLGGAGVQGTTLVNIPRTQFTGQHGLGSNDMEVVGRALRIIQDTPGGTHTVNADFAVLQREMQAFLVAHNAKAQSRMDWQKTGQYADMGLAALQQSKYGVQPHPGIDPFQPLH